MFSTITSGAIHGMESYLTSVEVDIAQALPGFDMVGLLNSEVREAKERVKVALKNSGIKLPPIRITVNLSPANIRKEGTAFDLPIAMGILTSLGHIPKEYVEDTLMIGELGLNGEIKSVKGTLPIVMEAKKRGLKRCLVPEANQMEGAIIAGIEIIGIKELNQALTYLIASEELKKNLISPTVVLTDTIFSSHFKKQKDDFEDINGQESLKRGVEVAAAGFHHILISGPPGSGKTMIAKRIPTILPPLSLEESLEVSKIYSVAGLLTAEQYLVTRRPFLSPHHTITEHALAGGGKVPIPGILSRAHRGVLFLDELPEFARGTLDVMRQPMEDKEIHIARSSGTFIYPADFLLVAAMNPCACGYYPDRNQCKCTAFEVKRYQQRIPGPILDRIDIHMTASKVKITELAGKGKNETSAQISIRIQQARDIQERRYQGTRFRFNADLGATDVKQYCPLGKKEQVLLERAFETMNMSARAYYKVIKVARTIADLEGSKNITEIHLSEAICYRMGEDNRE